jgi:hypothetical protein
MTMKTHSLKDLCLFVAPVLLLSGCTQLTVTKVTTTTVPNGVRYSLPKPYIQVTPQGDGSVVADVVYLPDPQNTYTVSSKSYLAAHSLTVSTEEGLLKKITWTGDSSAVAAQSISSGAAIGEKKLTADAKAVSEHEAKVSSAQKAVHEAQLAVDIAASNLELLVANNGSAEAILKAKLTLNEAQLKLEWAKGNLNTAAGGALGDKPSKKVGNVKIAGPVLFAINERVSNGSPTVDLVAATQKLDQQSLKQPAYESTPAFKPITETPKDPVFFPKGVEGLRPDEHGNMQLILIASSPISDIDATKTVLTKNGQKVALPPISLETPTTVRVALSGTAVGNYDLTLAFKAPQRAGTSFATIRFAVLR